MANPNELAVERAVALAVSAIENDPRRWPYGHHQRDRARAVRALRRLLVEHEGAN